MPFDVIIVGAGIGGLSSAIALKLKGHNVTVLESAKAHIPGIGAGIAINPNSARILDFFGIYQRYLKKAGTANLPRFQRSYTGRLISHRNATDSTDIYGYPMSWIHRADLIDLLSDRVEELGIPVKFNTSVKKVDDEGPAVILADGERVEVDLIVGADGIRSVTRKAVLPNHEVKLSGSLSIHRLAIPGETMRMDKDISHLLEGSCLWMGPGAAGAGSALREGSEYGLELAHDDGDSSLGGWAKGAIIEDIKNLYRDWDPAVLKILDHADKATAWRILETPPLPSWVSPSGNVMILGDAAHAMKPYVGQGGAMAIEDAACLSICLERASTTSEIPNVLHAFETIRKPRAELVARRSQQNAVLYHLPDGEAQRARDTKMRMAPLWKEGGEWNGEPIDELPKSPNDPIFMIWLFAYDVVKFTNKRLDHLL